MKINWKLRFKNKATLSALIALIVAFIYQVLGLFDVVPSVSESDVMSILSLIVNFLAAFGVIIDPTTSGINDSDRAMEYEEPAK